MNTFPTFTILSCYNDKTINDITRPEILGCGYKPRGCMWFSIQDAYINHMFSILGDVDVFNHLYSLEFHPESFTNDINSSDKSKILKISLLKDYIDFYQRYWREDFEGLDWDHIARNFAGVLFNVEIPRSLRLSLPFGIYEDSVKRSPVGGYLWTREVVASMKYIGEINN